MAIAKTKIIEFTNNNKTKHGIIFTTEKFKSESRKKSLLAIIMAVIL